MSARLFKAVGQFKEIERLNRKIEQLTQDLNQTVGNLTAAEFPEYVRQTQPKA
jgi:hypothetical protein